MFHQQIQGIAALNSILSQEQNIPQTQFISKLYAFMREEKTLLESLRPPKTSSRALEIANSKIQEIEKNTLIFVSGETKDFENLRI